MRPGAKLLDTTFTVVDQIRMNPKWTARYPGFDQFSNGILLLLDPPSCATDEEIERATAMASPPDGEELELEFHRAIVNKAGCIGLFFANEKSEIVPNGSTVIFKDTRLPVPLAEEQSGYVPQGQVDLFEARKIPRARSNPQYSSTHSAG